jgi:chitin deacetylase
MKKRVVIVTGCFAIMTLAAIVAIPRVLPKALSLYRTDITFAVATEKKEVFITIDDAPSVSTAEILAVLKKHEVPATFFIISNHVAADSQLEDIVRARHSLGNHLQSTKACSKLLPSEFRSSLDACSATLARFGGGHFFRPSSDFGTREQIAYARSKGYEPLMGTVFPMDHWITDSCSIVGIARWLSTPGGIVILHDGAVRGRTTAAVLDRLIPELKAAGYSFGRLKTPNQSPQHNAGNGPATLGSAIPLRRALSSVETASTFAKPAADRRSRARGMWLTRSREGREGDGMASRLRAFA